MTFKVKNFPASLGPQNDHLATPTGALGVWRSAPTAESWAWALDSARLCLLRGTQTEPLVLAKKRGKERIFVVPDVGAEGEASEGDTCVVLKVAERLGGGIKCCRFSFRGSQCRWGARVLVPRICAHSKCINK